MVSQQQQRVTMRIEPPDATFKSLRALLTSAATASAASHLSLIGSASLSTSITHYLATLPTDDARNFAQTLATSNAFWPAPPGLDGKNVAPTTQSTEKSDLLSRANLLFEATARAVLGRIQVVVHQRKGSAGWNAQRSLVKWVRAIGDAVHTDAASIPTACQPVPLSALAVQTGLVAGLQAARAQAKQAKASKSAAGISKAIAELNSQYALRRAEEEWCTLLGECMRIRADELRVSQAAQSSEAGEQDPWEAEFRKAALKAKLISTSISIDPAQEPHVVTLFLAAQVAPYVSAKRLTVLSADDLVDVLSTTLLDLFEGCGVLATVREDVRQDSIGQIALSLDSSTVRRADAFVRHPLFNLFGPLSRLLSLAFSAATRASTPVRMQEIMLADPLSLDESTTGAPLTRMHRIAQTWQAQWLSCRLAGATEDEIGESSRASSMQLWTVFKTMLFSYTMIFDALMEAIVDVCPSPTATRPIPVQEQGNDAIGPWQALTESTIPPAYLEAVRTMLLTYARLSWVTATFGSSAFDAYRRVFYEALEVLARDERASVALTVELMPTEPALHINAARRAESTYFLDVTEQLMAQLPDAMVEQAILPICRPYLDDRTYQEAFESAHSVVLSIYATGKDCFLEFTPYYVRLLLDSFPRSLSAEQLTLAFSTVMNAVSDGSDTLAWHALEQLWREIEKERFLVDRSGASLVAAGTEDAPVEAGDAATQRESDLSDVFVAQVPNVNLVLLRSTLSRVKRLIMHRARGGEARLALLQRTFASLAGLDASTREEGVRWWLEERERFGV